MIVSVHQAQYLPWLGYFAKIAQSDCFIFLDCVQYKHREYQNRNRIQTASGALWLTVPVITKGNHEQLISQVRIDNSSRWQAKHWQSIYAAYKKAPYFSEYADFFNDLYNNRDWTQLTELNVAIITYLLDVLHIKTALLFESALGSEKTSTERIIDLCKKVNAQAYLSGSGGKQYLIEQRFQDEQLGLYYQHYQHPVYNQHNKAKKDFCPYMSVIDLLFNCGADSQQILCNELGEI